MFFNPQDAISHLVEHFTAKIAVSILKNGFFVVDKLGKHDASGSFGIERNDTELPCQKIDIIMVAIFLNPLFIILG